jgi:hypothetical protein
VPRDSVGTIGAQRPPALVALLRDYPNGCKATLAELSCYFIKRAAIAVGCAVGERCGDLVFGRRVERASCPMRTQWAKRHFAKHWR